MRIALASIGSLGDLAPFLSMARELKRRGDDIILLCDPIFRAAVEQTGATFRPLTTGMDMNAARTWAVCMDKRNGFDAYVRNVALSHLRLKYDELASAVQNCDILISHCMVMPAPMVAEALQIPWICCILSPATLGWSSGPDALGDPKAVWDSTRLLNALRAELILPSRVTPFFDVLIQPDLILGLYSPLVGGIPAGWEHKVEVMGYSLFDDFQTGSTETGRFLDFVARGAPPIIFTLGSAAVKAAGDFFVVSAEAAGALKRRAAFIGCTMLPSEIALAHGDDILICDYVPYSLAFPHAAVVVHQGGAGTMAHALRAGRPTLVVPFAHDQPYHARRTRALGVGKAIPRDRYLANNAARALVALLSQPSYAQAAREVADRVNAEDGTHSACDRIKAFFAARSYSAHSQRSTPSRRSD